jgi:type I restriction enzyme S subunit
MTATTTVFVDSSPAYCLPSGWSEVPVERLIEKHFCGPSPDCEERELMSDEEWGVLKTTAITWDGWNETAHKLLPTKYWNRHHLEIHHGDVLITKAGPRDRVGVVVHVTTQPRHLIVSGKMIALRARSAVVMPQILSGVLALRETQDFLQARTTGMAESQVNFANTVLLNTKVRIPPFKEQILIAEVLDVLEAAIQGARVVLAKLKQVKSGLYHNLLTFGLDQHGGLRDPVRCPEQFQDSSCGKVPVDWEVLPFLSLCKFPTGQVDPRREPYRDWPLIAPDHIEMCTGRLLKLETAAEQGAISGKYVCEAGDVVYSKIRPYLRKAVLADREGLCSADMYPLRPSDRMNPRFLLMMVLGEAFSQFAVSVSERSGFPKINREELTSCKLAVPQRAEQDRVAELAQTFEARLAHEEVAVQKLKLLQRGLARNVLTGRIRVRA